MRLLVLVPLLLAACAPRPASDAAPAAAVAPPARPSGGIVPTAGAASAASLDTSTEAERQAAAGGGGGSRLGTAVVSLGNPAEAGFWLETSLVTAPGPGRVVLPATGQSVQVELRPAASGSRLSLAAMRLLGVALTDLPEVEVFAG